jgi:hypothetical protein
VALLVQLGLVWWPCALSHHGHMSPRDRRFGGYNVTRTSHDTLDQDDVGRAYMSRGTGFPALVRFADAYSGLRYACGSRTHARKPVCLFRGAVAIICAVAAGCRVGITCVFRTASLLPPLCALLASPWSALLLSACSWGAMSHRHSLFALLTAG